MSPFGLGTRVVVRVGGGGDMAVGAIGQQHPDLWTIQLAEPVADDQFPPGTRLVISTAVGGSLWVARSHLLRRSDAMLVVSRPRVQDRRDRRRDQRLVAAGSVAWSSRVGTGAAPAVDVSRSGLKLQVGDMLRVGDVVVLDVAGAARVSALVVALTVRGDSGPSAAGREPVAEDEGYAHLAFLRADEETRDAIVAALSTTQRAHCVAEQVSIELPASELVLGVSA